MARHVTDDPVRALTLGWRALPGPLRGWLRLAGPYGKAAALWGAGDRRGALTVLEARPERLAAFSLAVDQPAVARSALARISEKSSAGPVLSARLAYREGRLDDAVRALSGASGWRAKRLRRTLLAEIAMLEPGALAPAKVRDFGSGSGENREHNNTSAAERPVAPATPARILHIVTDALPSTSAGYTVRTQEIAVAQRAAGMEPHVVSRIGFPVTSGAIDGRPAVSVNGVEYHRLLPWIMPARMDAIAETGLAHAARLVTALRPSVLHAASNFQNALIAIALRDGFGLPYVYEVRGFWEDTWLSRHAATAGLEGSDRYVRNRALETHCMTSADLVVTLGEAMRDEIIARGVPADKVIIVPNGVSTEFLRPLPPAGPIRARLGLAEGDFAVGVVSSLVAHEGLSTLLEAVKLLQDGGVPARALIVGDGPERNALQRRAEELGLSDAIFTGRVPLSQVRNYHAALDVFVVPRTPDRVCQLVTPLKPVEAMASGLPVVVSGVSALGEIIKDEVTGMQFPPGDAAALAEHLRRLHADPDLRRSLGENARAWVAHDRTWEHNAARYRDAYARLGAM
ncbi:MAG TPA: glycosyltransferase family 4 protein [Trebonia sp.]|jgi:glycosyltransferase involved in cell wall biosynthesis